MAKAKKVRPEPVIIEDLGGRDRRLQYDLNAFLELEKRYGSVDDAMKQLGTGGMAGIKIILWAGLIHDEAILDEITGEPVGYNITPYQVGGWITPDMLPEVTEKITQAVSGNLPDIASIPGAEEELKKAGIAIVDGKPQVATVVFTDEEKAEERKNG